MSEQLADINIKENLYIVQDRIKKVKKIVQICKINFNEDFLKENNFEGFTIYK